MRMSERPKPYVGVSGVCNYLTQREPSGLEIGLAQQLFVEAAAENTGLFETGRLLALGVKAIHRTQWNDEPFVRGGVEYGDEWYPVGEEQFTTALRGERQHPQTLRVAQAYLHPKKAGDSSYFHAFMNRIHWRGADWIQAVQYDSLPWHENPDLLHSVNVTRRYFLTQSILQCHEGAMNKLGPKGVAKTLGKYAGGLDYVLFDASHGTGKKLDAKSLDPFLEEVHSSEALSHVGFGVAGGLDGASVQELLPSLLEKYDLSVDAEKKLHPLNNRGTRPLQLDEVRTYFQAMTSLLL